MIEIPIFLYGLMYIVFSSAIPVLMMMFLLRLILKSGKKMVKTAKD